MTENLVLFVLIHVIELVLIKLQLLILGKLTPATRTRLISKSAANIRARGNPYSCHRYNMTTYVASYCCYYTSGTDLFGI
jgi:hypothetical protein